MHVGRQYGLAEQTRPPANLVKYAVCQYGARAHYAVPRILYRHGALVRLFTDICAIKGWPYLLKWWPEVLRPAIVRRLASRVPVGIPPELVTAFTVFGWKTNRRWAMARTQEEATACYLQMGREFSKLIIDHGLQGADGVYAFNGEALELLRHARKKGIRTVLEQTIAPKEREIELLREEAELHPGWGAPPEHNPLVPEFLKRQHAEWAEADIIVCGSEFVADGIKALARSNPRVEVVPYGVDSTFSVPSRQEHGGPLRVLTVGTIGQRKGSPYVYEAARRLKGRAMFRMVGSADAPLSTIAEISECVQVVSRVPRSEIINHYAWADVFLLPSLCEGSAISSYEALAAGLPVIATPNAGTIVRDGIEGFIVPIRNAAAIIDGLDHFRAKPKLLTKFSQAARKRAADFTLEAYGERLTSLLLN